MFQFVVEAQAVAGAVSWRRRVVSQGVGGRLQEEWQQEHRCPYTTIKSCKTILSAMRSSPSSSCGELWP